MKIVPSQIVAARKRARMSQRELADALEVTVQAVSQWENGKTDPIGRIDQLASALSCTPSFLTGDDKSPHLHVNNIYTSLISIIDIGDLGDFISAGDEDRKSMSKAITASTVEARGFLFGIVVSGGSKYFNKGDVLIFDNGVSPEPGDFAAMLVLSERGGRVSFSTGGNVQLHGASGIVAHIVDGPTEIAEPNPTDLSAEVHSDIDRGPMVLAGTLVERRTFPKAARGP